MNISCCRKSMKTHCHLLIFTLPFTIAYLFGPFGFIICMAVARPIPIRPHRSRISSPLVISTLQASTVDWNGKKTKKKTSKFNDYARYHSFHVFHVPFILCDFYIYCNMSAYIKKMETIQKQHAFSCSSVVPKF